MPFWFWNDDLELDELLRQLRAFHAADFGGFVLHPRIGLSRRVGYLTDEFFRLVRAVVEEAARLEMKVILYDEGSYPSGAAGGAVVAENPDYASQAIGLWQREVSGPFDGFWRPNTGRALLDRHVATVLARLDRDDRVDPVSLQLLEPADHDIVRIVVGDGRWRVMSVWNTHGGGHIRGVFADQETGSVAAPPAADLLNPEAVACFLRLTHDRYFEHLSPYFGSTVIAMFTDEPHLLGKDPLRLADPQPYTPGLADWLQREWGEDLRPWLPALWVDYGSGTEDFRRRYWRGVQQRLHEVFYGAQARWCADHGIALTGHPAESEELSSLRLFQMPGQDMVWRYIEPDQPAAIEGRHSVAAKVATSGARLVGARRVLTEVAGAYGWRLTLEELKWLYDWHLIRGNNLIDPHAVFYSIRERRAWESEPDLFLHNVWRDHVPALNRYAMRMCGALCDGEQVCSVAILVDGENVAWRAARELYRSQIDFLYVDDPAVAGATVEGGKLRIGDQAYAVLVDDGAPPPSDAAQQQLEAFVASGGHLLRAEDEVHLAERIAALTPLDLQITPAHPDLRYLHLRRDGIDLYLLANEGAQEIEGQLAVVARGEAQWWDPWSGRRYHTAGARPGEHGGLSVPVQLGRREAVVLAVGDAAKRGEGDLAAPPQVAGRRRTIEAEWETRDGGGWLVPVDGLTDWARSPGMELYSGTVRYAVDLDVDTAVCAIDLGRVGDIARLLVDGVDRGARLWAPYVFPLDPALPAGHHRLEVEVTNSMANEYEGAQLPSGLMGPVELVIGG